MEGIGRGLKEITYYHLPGGAEEKYLKQNGQCPMHLPNASIVLPPDQPVRWCNKERGDQPRNYQLLTLFVMCGRHRTCVAPDPACDIAKGNFRTVDRLSLATSGC